MKLESIKKKSIKQLIDMGNKSEFTIQCEIINFCKIENILCFSVPNEATRNNSKFLAMGVLSGVSDLVLVLDSKVLFIELKTETGNQSETQKKFENNVSKLGHEYHICRSLTEFKKIIND